MKTIYYAVKHKKYGLLGIESTSNVCNSCTICFTKSSDHPWLTNNLKKLNHILKHPTPWYNSSIDEPMHSYKREDLEIIEVSI
jgi:hypothetical protein